MASEEFVMALCRALEGRTIARVAAGVRDHVGKVVGSGVTMYLTNGTSVELYVKRVAALPDTDSTAEVPALAASVPADAHRQVTQW